MRIALLGDSHIAGVYAAHWLTRGHSVHRLSLGYPMRFTERLPVAEAGLSEYLAAAERRGEYEENRPFSGAYDVLHLAQDVIVDETGVRDPVQLAVLGAAVAKHAPAADRGVLISSQVPAGTNARWRAECGRVNLWCYLPENVQLGAGLEYAKADGVVRYGSDDTAADTLIDALIAGHGIGYRIGSLLDAELFKTALNCLLATVIAASTELYALCRTYEADVERIAAALRTDPRIGNSLPVDPGPPFSGPTLFRELVLAADGDQPGSSPRSPVLTEVLLSDVAEIGRYADGVAAAARPDGVVLFIGMAYKAAATFAHSSLASSMLRAASDAGARVLVHHPDMDQSARIAIGGSWVDDLDNLPAWPTLVVRACGPWWSAAFDALPVIDARRYWDGVLR